MPHQALNKDIDNLFKQFDRTAELIIKLISVVLDRNNKSLNIANIINNNINDEINNYRFTFDVPTEIEIQLDMEEILKNKKNLATPPPPNVPPPLLTKKEIETERNKENKDFIKAPLQMNKNELDAANESADQKNKKVIRDIMDPTPGLFIDDKLNHNEQNLQNTTDNNFNLPPQAQQQFNETVFTKIIKQPIIQPTLQEIIPNVVPKTEYFFIDDDEFDSLKKPESMETNIGQPKDENYNDLVMISDDDDDDDDDEAKISKSLIKTDIEIKNKNNLKCKKENKK